MCAPDGTRLRLKRGFLVAVDRHLTSHASWIFCAGAQCLLMYLAADVLGPSPPAVLGSICVSAICVVCPDPLLSGSEQQRCGVAQTSWRDYTLGRAYMVFW